MTRYARAGEDRRRGTPRATGTSRRTGSPTAAASRASTSARAPARPAGSQQDPGGDLGAERQRTRPAVVVGQDRTSVGHHRGLLARVAGQSVTQTIALERRDLCRCRSASCRTGSSGDGKARDRCRRCRTLLAARTTLDDAQIDHLQRLVGEWQLLSDLAFADLLLWVPVAAARTARPAATPAFLCAAQCRPTTGPTAYQHDQVGVVLRGERVAAAAHRVRRGRGSSARSTPTGTVTCRSAARRSRSAATGRGDRGARPGRQPGQRAHPEPARAGLPAERRGPRRDGRRRHVPGRRTRGSRRAPARGSATACVRLEPDGTIIYASPNALSAFSRLGVTGTVLGEPFDALTSTRRRRPVRRERPGRRGRRRRSTAGTRRPSRSTAGERPCCSGRSRCARAARRSARCC